MFRQPIYVGLNTQQHIHEKLIEKAKEKLSTTDLTVSEIAYELGLSICNHSANFLKKRPVKVRWHSEQVSINKRSSKLY